MVTHELLVGAGSHQPAAFEHDDAVGAADGGEVVGDDHGGPTGAETAHGLGDGVLVVGVEARQRLIEDEHGRVGDERPGDAETLTLTPRELDTTLACLRVEAVGQGGDELPGHRAFRAPACGP